MNLQILPRENGFIVRTADGVEIVAPDGSPFESRELAEIVAAVFEYECQRRLVARN